MAQKEVMPLSLDVLQLANAIRNKEWDPHNVCTPLFHATELGGECGEALNKIKKYEREKLGLRGSRATIEEIAEELSDVIICCALVANAYNIDLSKSVITKFNETSEKNSLSVRLTETDIIDGENT